MSNQCRLWPALEDVWGQAATLAEWRNKLGDQWDSAPAVFYSADRYAESYVDSKAPNSPYKVVWHNDDDIVGVPLGGGATISLDKTDLLIYRLDVKRLCRTIATALGLSLVIDENRNDDRYLSFGRYRPVAGYVFPAYLAIPHDPTELRVAVEAIISTQQPGPFLLFVPTTRHFRSGTESLLLSQKACFLALEDTLGRSSPQKNWIASPIALQRLNEFQALVVPGQSSDEGMTFFPTPADAKWSDVCIRFVDGHTVSIKVLGVTRVVHFAQMGMANNKNAKPTVQWDLLKTFSRYYGVLTWDSSEAGPKNQKRREYLSRDLKKFFRLDADPIEYLAECRGWRTIFSIQPDD